MDTLEEYLQQTETAAQILFEGIDKYLETIKSVPLSDVGTTAKWSAAQKQYIYESFAMATLCGAVLQLAYMAIKQYSNNSSVPDRFNALINRGSLAKKFCIGREKHSVPIGLIIYAGRNQAAHYDDIELREPNKSIFEKLCKRTSKGGREFRDPALDLNNGSTINFAGNITYILDWCDYDAYQQDMRNLLC